MTSVRETGLERTSTILITVLSVGEKKSGMYQLNVVHFVEMVYLCMWDEIQAYSNAFFFFLQLLFSCR